MPTRAVRVHTGFAASFVLLLLLFCVSVQPSFGQSNSAGPQPPPPSQAILDTYQLGLDAWNSGHAWRALQHFRDAVDLARTERADTDGLTRHLLRIQAKAELVFAYYDTAEALVLEANAAVRRIHSDTHPELAEGFSILGEIWHGQRRFQDARDAYDQALALSPADAKPMQLAQLHLGRAKAQLELEQFEAAETDYRHALGFAETALGPDSPDLSFILSGLGQVFHRQERWDEARPVLERRLSLDEEFFGVDGPGSETALADLGMLEWRAGNYGRSMSLYSRAAEAQEKNLGPDATALGLTLSMLSHAASSNGHFGLAADSSIRALDLLQAGGLEDEQQTAQRREGIAYLLERAGRLEEAKERYREILQTKSDPDDRLSLQWTLASILLRLEEHDAFSDASSTLLDAVSSDPDALKEISNQAYWDLRIGAISLSAVKLQTVLKKASDIGITPNWDRPLLLETLSQAYMQLGLLEEADGVLTELLTSREENPETDPWVLAYALELKATLARQQHRYETAKELLARSIDLRERSSRSPWQEQGEEVVALGALNAYADLASLHQIKGDAYAAEPLLRKALLYAEASYGTDHAWVAPFITRLAEAYSSLGDYDQASALYTRALKIMEPSINIGSVEALPLMSDVAWFLFYGGVMKEALPIAAQALEIGEGAYGPKSRSIVDLLILLSELKAETGEREQAKALLVRAVAIMQHAKQDPALAEVLRRLARWHLEAAVDGEGIDKDADLRDARQHLEHALSVIAPIYGDDHPALAVYHDDLGQLAFELGDPGQAIVHSREAIRLTKLRVEGASSHKQDEDVRQLRLDRYRFMNHIGYLTASEQREIDFPESFDMAQLAGESSISAALRRTNARLAAGSGPLAENVRALQDARSRAATLDADLLAALGRPADSRDWRLEDQLRTAVAKARENAVALSDRIKSEFPGYGALIKADPIPADVVQRSLNADEAYVMFRLDDEVAYAWVLRADRRTLHVLPHAAADLDALVAGVRETLEVSGNRLPRFSVRAARRLHDALFAPLSDSLTGVRHIIITPDRALQSLPFELLITEKPEKRVVKPQDYISLSWLADKYSITITPSPAAMVALRSKEAGAAGDLPFVGFGDPVLEGAHGDAAAENGLRGARGFLFSATGLADPTQVRKLAPLPDTADELDRIATLLGGGAETLYLREAASEPNVRSAPLDRAQILAFATHGLLAGEFPGMAEPALVLTPPTEASVSDDGLLSAGEIATLTLDAELVILSACNTAGPNGEPGAEGLSGLARAFFHAGARSLLVSHWPVESRSASLLTTGMIEVMAQDRTLSVADALRISAKRLRANKEHPNYAHPAFWAPFSVVGGGTRL